MKAAFLFGSVLVLLVLSSGCVSDVGNFIMSGPGDMEYNSNDIKQRNSAGCLISQETYPVDCAEHMEPCSPPDLGCKEGYYCGTELTCVDA